MNRVTPPEEPLAQLPPLPKPVVTRASRHETICIAPKTKSWLDALSLLGRRSRSSTIEVLIQGYLASRPALRALMEERAADPLSPKLPKRPERRAGTG